MSSHPRDPPSFLDLLMKRYGEHRKQRGVEDVPLFSVIEINVACDKCKQAGTSEDCLHLVEKLPRWDKRS